MNMQRLVQYLDVRSVRDTLTDCWNWIGSTTKGGYGTANNQGIKTTAHRLIYWVFNGDIAKGHDIHHKCENPLCVNPEHLQSILQAEHAKLSVKAQQTHCVNGHEFTEQNTYRKLSTGTRVCRMCAATRARELRKSSWKK